MISVKEATQIVLQHAFRPERQFIPLQEATGLVLDEPLAADRDFPPFDRIMMDGIAIRYADFAAGERRFPVKGVQPAGSPRGALYEAGCLEVMTGAPLPQGLDTVIPYEDLNLEGGIATLQKDDIHKGQNVHNQGADQQAGASILDAGRIISPAEIGVLATIGKAEVAVRKPPRVTIFSTGDELVPVHENPLPHQIRASNVHTMAAALRPWNVDAHLAHLPDDPAAIRESLEQALATSDAILLSGGVSKGKFDHFPGVLEELGVEKLFYRVRQRPGKPFWFGMDEARSCTVFAMPGNPVSSFMCTQRYFRPWLRKSLGLEPMGYRYLPLAEDHTFRPSLTYFLQVRLENTPDGTWQAWPVPGRGSGDLANLVAAEGFLELPDDRDLFRAGEVFPYISYRTMMD